jgi:hypothetical protein
MSLVKVKVSRGTVPFSPMGVDSADTGQPPNGKICMDKSHLQGASKIKLKKVNKKRTITVRRVIIFF